MKKNSTAAVEANFDGLVGPTHNYAGLSVGNIASTLNSKDISNPKEGALQGLMKMKALTDMGFTQGVLAPQQRPATWILRDLGFSGSDEQIIEKAWKSSPHLLSACYSASSMWAANAATVSPSSDCHDKKVHITTANLSEKFHRRIESKTTSAILRATFKNEKYFAIHDALIHGQHFGDEGAANHTRFCRHYGEEGVEFFVYGRSSFNSSITGPKKFAARQTLEASEAIARLHNLDPQKIIFAQQNPAVIDAGVFHNDVISVGNQNVYFYHEKALAHTEQVLQEIKQKFGESEFHMVKVPSQNVSVADAVSSYLFNSQLVTMPSGNMALFCPRECEENQAVHQYLQDLVKMDHPIKEVRIFDVKQSMKNGGGPACLRLRVVLTPEEKKAVNPRTLMSDDLFVDLKKWVEKHYRDRLAPDDLRDPKLIQEGMTALDELTTIMDLGTVYPFQT